MPGFPATPIGVAEVRVRLTPPTPRNDEFSHFSPLTTGNLRFASAIASPSTPASPM
ncbi:hypothetical protein SAMN03159423_1470 [Bradyrhizobium sp. NFR13]|nr:hypothetical protein SAMN03159423_1470 [Bradyrhizobium sp. NFR13]